MGPLKSLYWGKVFHKRSEVAGYQFSHRIFYIQFSLSQLEGLSNALFSVNRFNLFSFYNKDHGHRTEGSLKEWALGKLHEAGYDQSLVTEIVIQTMPRVLGFVFNPVSFWYCYKGSELYAIIAEVNNTFGESHSYVLCPKKLAAEKQLHVSPFFKVEGNYRFAISNNSVKIDYFKNNRLALTASMSGEPLEWKNLNFLKTFILFPLQTYAVVFLIHLHAIVLFFKKVPFYGKNGNS